MIASPLQNITSFRFLILAAIACVIGIVVSLAAIAFVEGVHWLNEVLYISPRTRVQVHDPLLLNTATILVPTIGGLVVGILLQKAAKERRPLGPPDAIRAVQLRANLPDERSGFVSTLAALISLGCGASVGQYGPMVYMGSFMANIATRLKLKIPDFQAIAIACGVAAAISTAFNAPIAGLVFAHEIILRHYSLQAFAPTTVAAATGYIVANVIFERPAIFLVEFEGVSYSYEFVIFALIGVICAFLAVGFMQLTMQAMQWARQSFLPAIWRPAFAGFCVGMVALEFEDVLGVGAEALRFATIEGAFTTSELAGLVIAKIALTALCIGFGFAGGVFSPALLIGILLGALFWSWLAFLGVPNSGVVVYAICAMMALTSPIIGAPLTMILIVFELTHSYDLTIAAMVSVVFANVLSHRLFGRSMYDVQLASKGIDLSSGRDRAMLQHTYVKDLSLEDYPCFQKEECPLDVINQLAQDNRAEGIVVNTIGIYQGMFHMHDLIGKEKEAETLETLCNKKHLTFDESTNLWQAMRHLDKFVGEVIPIVSSKDQRLIGVITEAQLIAAYLKTMRDLRREENEVV